MNTRNEQGLSFTQDAKVIEEGKTMAIISYITMIGLLIAFVMNNEKRNAFANFHLRQSLGLLVSGLVLSVANVIPIAGWIVAMLGFVLLFVLWLQGLFTAINGKAKPVAILGNYFQDWFKGI